MKIAYVANIRFPTEKAHGIHIAKACEALAKRGEEVVLLVPARKNPITTPAFEYYGVKTAFPVRSLFALDTVGWGMLGFWIESVTFALSVVRYLRAHSTDVVYGRDELVLSVLYWLGFKTVVWESHDGTWNRFSKYIAARAKGLVVVSQGLKEFYISKGVSAENILAVSNGITIADFTNTESKQDARARLGLPQEKSIALYIGRLDGWKGADTLLEASNLLSEAWLVAVIGGEEKQIRALKKQYPLAGFLGSRPYRELAGNQAAADVLVVPNTAKNDISVRFTSPLKLIAHMASRRPIVASNLPSIRELVDDSSAVLVEPDNPQALADGIQDAFNRADLAERAFEKAKHLDWSIRAEGILSFVKRNLG